MTDKKELPKLFTHVSLYHLKKRREEKQVPYMFFTPMPCKVSITFFASLQTRSALIYSKLTMETTEWCVKSIQS